MATQEQDKQRSQSVDKYGRKVVGVMRFEFADCPEDVFDKCIVRDATEDDAFLIDASLSEQDEKDLLAVGAKEEDAPDGFAHGSFVNSTCCRVLMSRHDDPLAIWGIQKTGETEGGSEGVVWLLCSALLKDYKKTFVRVMKEEIRRLFDSGNYVRMYNLINEHNEPGKKWIRSLGASFSASKIHFLEHDGEVRYFEFNRAGVFGESEPPLYISAEREEEVKCVLFKE